MSNPVLTLLSDLKVFFKAKTDAAGGRGVQLQDHPVLQVGVAPDGSIVPLSLNSAGGLDPASTGSTGVAGVAFTSADQSGAAAAVTSAPTTGQKTVVTDIRFSSDTAMSFDFTEETSGTLLFREYVPANGGGQITLRGKVKLATANKRLMVKTSAAGNISVTASYYSEA